MRGLGDGHPGEKGFHGWHMPAADLRSGMRTPAPNASGQQYQPILLTKLNKSNQESFAGRISMRLSEFMGKIDYNPYYPVEPADYPRMFDFEITKNGAVYLERLKKEMDSGEITDRKSLYLSLLYLAQAASMMSSQECKKWQGFMFLVGKTTDMYTPEIKSELTQMGCIRDNPRYDPKMYKRHLSWKMKALASISDGSTEVEF